MLIIKFHWLQLVQPQNILREQSLFACQYIFLEGLSQCSHDVIRTCATEALSLTRLQLMRYLTCGRFRCNTCLHTNPSTFIDTPGERITLTSKYTCVIKCHGCHKSYIGETGRRLGDKGTSTLHKTTSLQSSCRMPSYYSGHAGLCNPFGLQGCHRQT